MARLGALGASPAVLEATGGFETTVAAALCAAGFAVAAVDPRQARDFARAAGRRATGSVERVLKRSMDRGAVSRVATLRRNGPRAARRKRSHARRLA